MAAMQISMMKFLYEKKGGCFWYQSQRLKEEYIEGIAFEICKFIVYSEIGNICDLL